jgi:polyhydroxybutyrate depolymerase
MKARAKILGFAVAVLIVVTLGFNFVEMYAPSPANPTLSAAIQQNSIPIGSTTREFLEYVPRDISPHSPLVIVLHGSLMDANLMREWTGYEFDQLADQHGFVVVHPDGYKHNWNDCRSGATFPAHTENIDDTGFVKSLIAREVAQRQIDEKRVYVLGYSNGGEMALRLALQTPEQVAGIAVAGASLPVPEDSSCPGQGSLPLLVVEGDKDPFNPIDGGRVTLFGFGYRGRALSAFDTAQTFRTLHPPYSIFERHHSSIRIDESRIQWSIAWGSVLFEGSGASSTKISLQSWLDKGLYHFIVPIT